MGHTDPAAQAVAESDETVHQRIGQLTRTLHNALRELFRHSERLPDPHNWVAVRAPGSGRADPSRRRR